MQAAMQKEGKSYSAFEEDNEDIIEIIGESDLEDSSADGGKET
jgi:hypothetical protein